MSGPLRVLVLGGTGEARSLCAALARLPQIAATVSLAGVTRSPARYDLPTRRGGFGGVEGLTQYLVAQRIEALIDATHPFATAIAKNAAAAARVTGIPQLKLLRPSWRPRENERWLVVPDLASAATAIPSGARVFLATGHGSARRFRAPTGAAIILRVIDTPDGMNTPQSWTILAERPPFSVESELATFRKYGITHLVARNSGGAGGRTKLDAAAALGVEVVMVARPEPPAGIVAVDSVAGALVWLDAVAREAGSRLDTPRGD